MYEKGEKTLGVIDTFYFINIINKSGKCSRSKARPLIKQTQNGPLLRQRFVNTLRDFNKMKGIL